MRRRDVLSHSDGSIFAILLPGGSESNGIEQARLLTKRAARVASLCSCFRVERWWNIRAFEQAVAKRMRAALVLSGSPSPDISAQPTTFGRIGVVHPAARG